MDNLRRELKYTDDFLKLARLSFVNGGVDEVIIFMKCAKLYGYRVLNELKRSLKDHKHV